MKMLKEKLIESAAQALESAYAPYSSYRVGAALFCEDGSIFAVATSKMHHTDSQTAQNAQRFFGNFKL